MSAGRWFLIPLISLPFIAFPLVFAQQTIYGDLSGSLGPGIYIVVGSCRVVAGESLIIMPGTTFLHAGSYDWRMNGSLIAVGTEEAPIRFCRQEPIEDHKWGGLCFYSGSEEESILEWCEFEYCKSTNYPYDKGGAIYLDQVTIPIKHCKFTQCEATYGGAIYGDYSGFLTIQSCSIQGNISDSGGGIYLHNCTNAIILGCSIGINSADNGGGIYLDNCSNAIIRECYVGINSAENS
jgi:hypothetical protein